MREKNEREMWKLHFQIQHRIHPSFDISCILIPFLRMHCHAGINIISQRRLDKKIRYWCSATLLNDNGNKLARGENSLIQLHMQNLKIAFANVEMTRRMFLPCNFALNWNVLGTTQIHLCEFIRFNGMRSAEIYLRQPENNLRTLRIFKVSNRRELILAKVGETI